eukprot:gene25284-30532_t
MIGKWNRVTGHHISVKKGGLFALMCKETTICKEDNSFIAAYSEANNAPENSSILANISNCAHSADYVTEPTDVMQSSANDCVADVSVLTKGIKTELEHDGNQSNKGKHHYASMTIDNHSGGTSEYSHAKSNSQLQVKFDTACSRCVSGRAMRLRHIFPTTSAHYQQQIKGFNGSSSRIALAGLNENGKIEYYVPDMPEDLCLLCAHDYAKDGAVVLFADRGLVLKLTPQQALHLREMVENLPRSMDLKVKNRTYEVDTINPGTVVPHSKTMPFSSPVDYSHCLPALSVVTEDQNPGDDQEMTPITTGEPEASSLNTQEAYGTTGTNYFVSRVNVTKVEELILAYLLSGFTLTSLRTSLKNNSISGLHPGITVKGVDRFARKYGATPDVLALAFPHPYGGERGYFSQPAPTTKVGQNVQCDYFEPDYTQVESQAKNPTRRVKIVSLGGAKYGFLAVDKYSKFSFLILCASTDRSLDCLKSLVSVYKRYNHKIELLCADSGVLPSKTLKVLDEGCHAFLRTENIATRQAEPYYHQNGTPDVEREILNVKQKIDQAFYYVTQNPNFPHIGLTKTQIFRLWGEVATWAVITLNLQECAKSPGKTRHEVFTGVKPNLQDYRMLPIFSILYVLRHPATADTSPLGMNKTYWQRGLYVGPDLEIKGGIRVATASETNKLVIIRTTHFKHVSDGGNINIYPYVNSGLRHFIADTPTVNVDGPQAQQPQQVEDVLAPRDDEVPDTTDDVTTNNDVLNGDTTEALDSPEHDPTPQTGILLESGKDTSVLSQAKAKKTPRNKQRKKKGATNAAPTIAPPDAISGRSGTNKTRQTTATNVLQPTTTLRDPQMTETGATMHPNLSADLLGPKNRRQPKQKKNSNIRKSAVSTSTKRPSYMEHIHDILSRLRRPRRTRDQELLAATAMLSGEDDTTIADQVDVQPTTAYSSLTALYKAYGVDILTPEGVRESDMLQPDCDEPQADPMGPFRYDSASSFSDWSTHLNTDYYWVPLTGDVVVVDHPSHKGDQLKGSPDLDQLNTTTSIQVTAPSDASEDCFRAVTQNVPKSFQKALTDPIWGEPARKEWDTILDAKTLLKLDRKVALQLLKDGADLVILFPVYEQKVKEGKEVFKVRLVANGKEHHPTDSVYSPTPRREELLLLLHLAAINNWEIVHIDEVRAFLSAKYKDSKPVVTKHVGSSDYYQVIGALYGLKSSPKDYQTDVTSRLINMGFERLPSCQCIYIKKFEGGGTLIVYDYVDDFICTGSVSREFIVNEYVNPFRGVANTTEPLFDPTLLLGMETVRLRDQHLILITMTKRIDDLVAIALLNEGEPVVKKTIPIPPARYLVQEEQFSQLIEAEQAFLSPDKQKLYMRIIGCLIWITGVRHDIVFATTYLSWFTQKPRVHHLRMAKHVVHYLHFTRTIPLVLGGGFDPRSYSDSSLAQGPKRRSINGHLLKMHPLSGAILSSSHATVGTRLNTFEAELDAATTGFKELAYIRNLLLSINYPFELDKPLRLHCDNLAMVNFVKGEGTATGVRYMDIRLWYTRELYCKQQISIEYMSGQEIPANLLTKLGNGSQHAQFLIDCMGLTLLTEDLRAKYNLEQLVQQD